MWPQFTVHLVLKVQDPCTKVPSCNWREATAVSFTAALAACAKGKSWAMAGASTAVHDAGVRLGTDMGMCTCFVDADVDVNAYNMQMYM